MSVNGETIIVESGFAAPRSAPDRLQSALMALIRLSTRPASREVLLGPATTLSMTDIWLLTHLTQTGPARLSELATWQDVDRSTITVQVQRLERAELVRRSTDPTDGRAALVGATRMGRKTLGRIVAESRAALGEILETWSDQEQDALVESLERLVTSIAAHTHREAPEGHLTK